MKKKLLLFLILCSSYNIRAQSLSGEVISTSGAFFTNGSGMLSTTIGEMSVVKTLSAGGFILTQGFQQPWDFGVGIAEVEHNEGINVYPNPTTGSFTIQFGNETHADAIISVYDCLGKLVLRKVPDGNLESSQIPVTLADQSNGLYFLDVSSRSGNYQTKINLTK